MSIVLHIERIVLDGVSLTRAEEHVLLASLESQLRVLLSQPSTRFDRGYAVPFLRAPQTVERSDPAGTGRAVAHGIHSTLAPLPVGPSRGSGRRS